MCVNSESECVEIHARFAKDRSTLPLMFISSPVNRLSQLWTKRKPTAPVLQRITLLAHEAHTVLQQQLEHAVHKSDFKVTCAVANCCYIPFSSMFLGCLHTPPGCQLQFIAIKQINCTFITEIRPSFHQQHIICVCCFLCICSCIYTYFAVCFPSHFPNSILFVNMVLTLVASSMSVCFSGSLSVYALLYCCLAVYCFFNK